MAGKRYSAGAIFLQVVPVFANVQRAIEDEAKNIDRALGDQMERSGEKAGQRAGKAASKAMAKEGEEGAKAYAGHFETQIKNVVKSANREISRLDLSTASEKMLKDLDEAKAKLKALSDQDFNIDFDSKKVISDVAALSTAVEAITKGKHEINVDANFRKVLRDIASARKVIDAAFADREVKVEVEVVTAPAEREMSAFEKKFKQTAKRAAESLSGNLSKEARKIKDELKYLENLRVGVDISGNRARAELKEIAADLERLDGSEVDIEAKIALAGARAELATWEAQLDKIDGRDITVDVNVDSKGLDRASSSGNDAANSFRSFNIILLAVTSAGPALIPVLAGIAGGLVALGPAAAVGAFGLGAVLAGFSGIGNALGALQSQQDATATNAQTNAGRMSGAADAIRSAQEALADAERAAGRAAEDAADRVADARRSAARAAEDSAERVADARESAAEAIKDALKAQKDAQEEYRDAIQDVADAEQDLRDARADAQKDADTLANRQRQNAVDERDAVVNLFDAQVEYNAVMADGSSTDVDKERASINLEQAQISLNDTRDEQVALSEEAADYAANGVDGSEQVKDAQDAVTDALEAQKEAQEAVKEAARDSDEARLEGAELISEALEDQAESASDNARVVREALEDQAESASDSARAIDKAKDALARARKGQDDLNDSITSQEAAVNTAMDALGPAGRKFALYLFGLRGEWHAFRDDLQAAMLPSVQSALEGFFASPNASKAREAMVALAGAFGDFTLALSQSFQGPAWGAFFEMLATTGPEINAAYGGAFISLFEAFASILTVTAPFALRFAEGLEKMMGTFADWAASKQGAQDIKDFIAYVEEVGPAVLDFFGGLAGAFVAVVSALAPFGGVVLGLIDGFLELIATMDKDLLTALLTGITVVLLSSQIAYAVMNVMMAGAALFASTVGAWVFFIVAIGAALVYLYNTNEDFAAFIDKAWDKIGGVISKAWKGMIKPALESLMGALTNLWENVFMPFLAWLGPKLVWLAEKLIPMVAWYFATAINSIAWVINNILVPVATKMGEIFAWVWDKVIKPTWDAIVWAWDNVLRPMFEAIGTVVGWLWENVFKPVFGFIGGVVSTVFNAIVAVWKDVLWPVIKTIGTVVLDLYKLYFKVAFVLMKAAWKALTIAIKWAWENILKPAWDNVKNAAVWLWEKALRPAFSGIKSAWKSMSESIKTNWDKYGQPIFDWIADKALPPLQAAFQDTIGVIGGLWEGLKKMIGSPIKFVIEKILNEGVIDSFNKIAGWVGEDGFEHIKVPEWAAGYATGGILPGYTPGRDVHTFRSPTAGTLALSGGEAIMRPEWTAAMGSGYVDGMNKIAANGGVDGIRKAMGFAGGGIMQAFAKGGVVFPVPGGYVNRSAYNLGHDGMDINHPNDASGKVPYVSATSGRVTSTGYSRGYGNAVFVASPYGELVYGHSYDGSLKVAAGSTVSPGQTLANIGNTGNSDGAHLHFGFPGGTFGAVEALLAGAAKLNPEDVAGGGRAIPSWLMSIVKNPLGAFKGWITDPLKNAAASIAGTPIFDMVTKVPALLGKKVVDKVWDIIPGWVKTTAGWAGDAADWAVGGVKNAAGAVGDVAGDVAGGVKNGAGAVADFLGFADGGILPYNGTMMYDNGGYLPPGMTTVMNLTGKPEPVFTADQFDGLGVGGQGESFTYAPTFDGSDLTAADVVDDLDFHRRKVAREGRYGRSMT